MNEFETVTKHALNAGHIILKTKKKYGMNYPAAKKCELYCYEELKNIALKTNLPVVSKFDRPDFECRKYWNRFWIIAPLLGKKNLREGKDDYLFTVTKIENQRPVLGVIVAPEKSEMYIAKDARSYKIKGIDFDPNLNVALLLKRQNMIKKPIEGLFFTILKNRQPMNYKTEKFLKDFKDYKKGAIKEIVDDSPMNFCGIAEGKYDYYPHFSTVMEWDIAAFDALITASGYMITKKDGILPLSYNTKDLKFPAFIAKNNFENDNVDLEKKEDREFINERTRY